MNNETNSTAAQKNTRQLELTGTYFRRYVTTAKSRAFRNPSVSTRPLKTGSPSVPNLDSKHWQHGPLKRKVKLQLPNSETHPWVCAH